MKMTRPPMRVPLQDIFNAAPWRKYMTFFELPSLCLPYASDEEEIVL